MSLTALSAFDDFYAQVSLPGDHSTAAARRREWVVSRLRSGGFDVLDAMAIGSIPRRTALIGQADVDILAALHFGKHIADRKPSRVLSDVKAALNLGTAGSIRRNGQAVTIRFQSWPNVDLVPASRLTDTAGRITSYHIPNMHTEEWIRTNPPEHAAQVAAAASARGPNFRRLIKMAKHWASRQTPRMQSYHIEVIALNLASADWADLQFTLLQWFQAAQPACTWLAHGGADVSSYLNYGQAAAMIARLAQAETNARSAWYASVNSRHRDSIQAWRSVFGNSFPTYG